MASVNKPRGTRNFISYRGKDVTARGVLLLLAGVARGADGGCEIGVLGYDEAPAKRKTEPLHLLHESEQARQLPGQHDIFLATGARTGEREHADRFGDHVHDRERLVLGRRVGAYLAEVRGGGAGRQIADRSAGDVANAEIDSPQVAFARKFLEPLDRRDAEHVLGESEQRAAAHSRAAEMRD